jgi:hypothetical protein
LTCAVMRQQRRQARRACGGRMTFVSPPPTARANASQSTAASSIAMPATAILPVLKSLLHAVALGLVKTDNPADAVDDATPLAPDDIIAMGSPAGVDLAREQPA